MEDIHNTDSFTKIVKNIKGERTGGFYGVGV